MRKPMKTNSTEFERSIWGMCQDMLVGGMDKIDDPNKVLWKYLRDKIDLDDSFLPECKDSLKGTEDLLFILRSGFFCIGYDMIKKMNTIDIDYWEAIKWECGQSKDTNANLIVAYATNKFGVK